jgi:hypothetical protein
MGFGGGVSRGIRAGLVVATLVGTQLAVAAVTQSPSGATGILPPSDPGANINFAVPAQCTGIGDESATCLDSLLYDIDVGRYDEGVPPMVLPTGFAQMSIAMQLLVVANLERGDRGLPQFAGLSPTLNAASALAAVEETDPTPPAGYTFNEWGSNFAGSVNALEADFLWMYDDGPGGTNIDCEGSNMTGCWGHRNNILGNWVNEGPQSTAMGDGTTGNDIFTEIFANKSGTPDSVVDPYSSVTYPTSVPPEVVKVSTNVASPGTGTPVTVNGNYFSLFSDGQTPTVDFGSSPATNVQVSWDGQLTADAPPNPFGGAAGTVVVTVTTPAGTSNSSPQSGINEFSYSVVQTPTVSAVSPSSGSQLGGEQVTITGADLSGVTGVAFGSTPATAFTVNSNSSITATVPASASLGTVDVVLTASGKSSSITSLDQFTYKMSSTTTPRVTSAAIGQGTPDTYSATVAGSGPEPTGTVTFSVGSATLCTTATLVSGGGSCQTSATPPGSDTVTATYSGDATYGSSSGSINVVVTSGDYTPLTPTRICDTRAGNPSGLTGAAAQCNGALDLGSTIPSQGTKTINVAGAFGVPADATAVVLNVTAVNPAAAGYLTVFPAGGTPPDASNLNFARGDVVPNLVEVGTGTGGAVSIYSSMQTDVVVDVEGYVAPAAGGGAGAGLYDPLPTPARICDTRAGNPSSLSGGDAQCNGTGNAGKRLSAGGTLDVQVTGNNGVPSDASAVVLNVTAVSPAAAGFLTVYPGGGTLPTASNVNYGAGQTAANRVIVPLSGGASPGQISIFSPVSADVVVDVSGYFAASGGTGTQFTTEAAPARICDTRAGNPSQLSGGSDQCDARTIGPGGTLTLQVSGLAGVPSDAKAVVVNLTGVTPTAPTFLTVYPGPSRPFASDLNPGPGQVCANLTVATLSANGTITIFNSGGSIDVVVDVLGWYS